MEVFKECEEKQMQSSTTVGALAGGLGVAAPVLMSALAPKVAAASLLVTMEYNIAMIGVGQFVAKNPTMFESALGPTISFIQGFGEGISGSKISPDIGPSFGNTIINAGASYFRGEVGEFVRSNYVEN